MELQRSSGVLLHPTSLPGPYGIGDLGPEAARFLRWLRAAGQRAWQVLPLGPTGYGDSPYQSFSAFAGNPLLISPDRLVEEGALSPADVSDAPELPTSKVDYGAASEWKLGLLREAHARAGELPGFEEFRGLHSGWLDDYALFMALKDDHGGGPWVEWPPELRDREPAALAAARERLGGDIAFYRFVQHAFFRQWEAVRREAASLRIQVVGDLPIFVAHDSADVWAHRELFYLDAGGAPTVVAGVPPDYFSETGQLWGNPLYRWDALAERGYGWWAARIWLSLRLYDSVRIDHFRGFESYWEVHGGAGAAVDGRWVPGPGLEFFRALRERLGELPIIAEDLGVITPEVEALRDAARLPGMKVLQFAWGEPDSQYMPHNYPANCVVYTGTHDNDTTRGWWRRAPKEEKELLRRYLGRAPRDISWDMLRLALGSVARLSIAPAQDLLALGSEARMNTPGAEAGNWTWRLGPDALTPALAERLRDLCETYGRAEREDASPTRDEQ
jgi:4-alpha-glucanotransferase